MVSHSLGTVVAYKLLKQGVPTQGVPLFVTLGSPLGIKAIQRRITPILYPPKVDHWFNAMDPQDIVALYSLSSSRFNVDPPVENKTDVDNPTPNQHGISGYLEDPEVARRIHDALVA